MPFDPDELVRLLTPHCMDSDAQQAFILGALGKEHPLIPDVHYDKSPATFILNMAQRVETYDPALLERLIAYAKAGGAKLKPRLFLSYARADDEPFVRRLYDDLREASFDPWFDREKMPSRGLTFTTEIAHAIDGAERLILVVGEGAMKSEYVRAEWEYALANCKPVIPILRLGELSLLPDELKQLHTPDFRAARSYAEALTELRRILDDAPATLGALKDVEPVPEWYIERPVDLKAMVNAVCSDGLTGAKPLVITSKQQTLSLTGIGGIGKTTLARALCHRCEVRYQFPDGIVWLEVGKSANAASLLGRAGELLGDQRSEYQSEPDAKARLAFWTSGKTALFVLDDVWDHQIAEAFKGVGKTCRLVVTTRQPQIVNKLGAASQTVDRLTEDEGIRLIDKHLGRPSDALRPHDTVERAIVRLLEGHTLSIHIAAARLKERGADFAPTLLSRLQNPDRLFKDLKMDETDKNHNLEVSLAESYTDLKSDGQRRFRALGVFAPEGTFDLGALKGVWADEDEADTDDGIDLLMRAGLLVRLDEGRYRLHNLLRAYARALAGKKGETEELFVRYAEWVTAQAAQFDENPPEAWGAFEPFLAPHVLEVGDRLVEQYSHITLPDEPLSKQALDFALRIDGYLAKRREMRRVEWLEMGLVAARHREDQKCEGLFLHNIGLTWSDLGEKRKALDYYEQALPLSRAVGDRDGEATTLYNIGGAWSDLGEKRKALDYLKQALPMFRAVGDRGGEAASLNGIGVVWSDLGEKRKALDYYEQALLLRRAVGDRRGEVATLNNIGMVWSDLGEKRKALDYYEQALPLSRAVGDRGGEATSLNAIGMVWSALGEKRKALDYYEQALPLSRAVGDRGGEATTLNNMGSVWSALGEQRKALEYYEKALPLFRAVGDRRNEATALNNMGGAWDALGEKRKALEYYEQALPLSRAVGDRSGEAYTLHNMSFIHEASGDLEEAIHCAARATELLEAIEDVNADASRQNLEWLKRKRDGEGSDNDPNAPLEQLFHAFMVVLRRLRGK